MAAAMAEFAFFLLFYSVPFLALFLLPRLRWLAIGAAVASLIVGGLFAAMQRSSGDAGIGAFLMFVVVALGFASGAVGRLALLALGPRGGGRKATLLAAALSYVTLPVLIVVESKVREAQHRSRYAPPSDECRSRLHEVKLGESCVDLPLLTGIDLSEGRSIEKSSSSTHPKRPASSASGRHVRRRVLLRSASSSARLKRTPSSAPSAVRPSASAGLVAGAMPLQAGQADGHPHPRSVTPPDTICGRCSH